MARDSTKQFVMGKQFGTSDAAIFMILNHAKVVVVNAKQKGSKFNIYRASIRIL